MRFAKVISLLLCLALILTLAACGEITKTAVEFNAQFIRTSTDEGFQKVTIIRSVEELNSFAQQKNDAALSEALEKYDGNYFKEQILIAVNETAGSGSITYSINSFQKSSDGKAYIDIESHSPEWRSDDMEYWYFLIEPEVNFNVKNEEDIFISYDDYLKVPLEYNAQYIKTKVYRDGFQKVTIIRSREEMDKFIETNKFAILFKKSDGTISLEEARKKYDDAYFKKRMLIIVLKENNNKSETPKINSFKKGRDGKIFVNIDWISNGESEFDEAHWFILIEPEKNFEVENEKNIYAYFSS